MIARVIRKVMPLNQKDKLTANNQLYKIILLSLFLLCQSLFAQKKYVFIPSFESGKNYRLIINHNGVMKDVEGKEYHKYEIKQKILLKLIQPVNDYFLYSWKIEDYNNGDAKCKCIQSFVPKLDFQFKTSSSGEYLGINNLENLKLQIKSILTKDFIKEFKKTRKDRYDAEQHLFSIKNNPEFLIAQIEKDILKYFRFYNSKFDSKPMSYSKVYRNNLSNERMKMPYSVSSTFIEKDGFYQSMFISNLDKKNATTEDWKSIFNGLDKDLDEFKKRYTSSIEETYVFSSKTGNVDEISIHIKENTSSHNNSTRIENFALKLVD